MRPPDALNRPTGRVRRLARCFSHVGPRAVQALKLDRVAREIGQGGQEAVAVMVSEAQLGAGVWAFAPAAQLEVVASILRTSTLTCALRASTRSSWAPTICSGGS